MNANDNVVVRIIGDASGVEPAVQATVGNIGQLEPLLAELTSQMAALTAQMREGFMSGAAAAQSMTGSLRETRVATEAEGNALVGMVMKVHEGAEAVRTFQMRAKAFAEIYVGLFAIESISRWAEKMGEAAEKTEHLAAKLGMTVPEVQGLSGAATMSGTNIDVLAKGLGLMDNKAVVAAGHSSSAAKAFAAMGIDARDGSTNMERLLKISDKFHDMADGPTKAALSMQLFGKSGREMIPFLNQGSAAIQQLMDKSKELGAVNEAAVAQGARLASSVNESKVAWDGLKQTLTEAFGPLLTQAVDGFIGLVKAMHDSYESGGAVKIIFEAIAEVVRALGEMLSAVGLAFSAVFSTTKSQGLDWGAVIKAVIDGIVVAFKTVVAVCVFVADAFIASFHLMKGAAEAFLLGFIEVTAGFRVAGTALGEFMQVVAKVCWDALHLEWGSIKADWENGMEHVREAVVAKAQQITGEVNQMKNAVKSDFADMLNTGKSFSSFYDQLMKPGAGPKHDDFKFKFDGGGGDAPDITNPGKGKKPKDDLVQQLDEELTARKVAWEKQQVLQGTAQEFSLESERDFWVQALARTNLSAKDKAEIEKKWIAASQAVQKEEIAKKLDGYKAEIEAAGSNSAAKLKILRTEAAYVHQMYGDRSKEAAAADTEIVRAERQAAEQLRQLWDSYYQHEASLKLIEVDQAQAAAQLQVEMGLKSKGQLLAQEKQFENQRFEIRRQELDREKALIDPNRDPVAYQKASQSIETLERQHQQKLTQIDQQAVLQRTQIQRNGINSWASSWGSALAKLATLQAGFNTTLKSLWQGLQQAIGGVIEQLLTKFLAAEATKLIFGKTTAQATIMSEAAKAGAGGVASMAAAPWPLDMGAPAFGTAMSAAAMAFTGLNSAEGGAWNVQPGLFRLHANEMVLPAWAAQGLRGMVGGGQTAPANSNAPTAANDGDLHLHIHSVMPPKPRELRRFFQEHDGAMAAGARSYARRLGSMTS